MKKSYCIILLINHFSMGLMVPVLSLALLERGLSLPELALIFGIFSFTVFALEVPSGVLADLAGRKRIFIISCFFYAAALIFLLSARSLTLLIPVIILWGAGKAFSSGSLDALFIDSYIETHGTDTLPVVTSRLALLETAGISAGAFLGGFLPDINKEIFPFLGVYDLNIILRFAMIAAVIPLSIALIRETRMRERRSVPFKRHISESFKIVRTNRVVLLLTLGLFLGGLFLFTLETYWQPAYTSLRTPDWTLGLLSFGCFLFASLGNIIVKRIFLRRQSRLHIGYIVSRLLLFAALTVFSLQKSAAGFGVMFFMIYFLFGGANMAESTMLNTQIPCDKRASLLSFASFAFQAGGLAAPLTALVASSQQGIRVLWGGTGAAFFAISAVLGALMILHKRYASAMPQARENDVQETVKCQNDARL